MTLADFLEIIRLIKENHYGMHIEKILESIPDYAELLGRELDTLSWGRLEMSHTDLIIGMLQVKTTEINRYYGSLRPRNKRKDIFDIRVATKHVQEVKSISQSARGTYTKNVVQVLIDSIYLCDDMISGYLTKMHRALLEGNAHCPYCTWTDPAE